MPLGQPPEQQLSAQASSRPSSSHSAARASSASKHPCCSNQALCSASQRRCCGANVAANDRSVARWEDSTRSGAKPDRRHRQWGDKARPRGSQEVFRVGRMTQLSPSTDGARPCPCFDDPVGDGAPAAAWLGDVFKACTRATARAGAQRQSAIEIIGSAQHKDHPGREQNRDGQHRGDGGAVVGFHRPGAQFSRTVGRPLREVLAESTASLPKAIRLAAWVSATAPSASPWRCSQSCVPRRISSCWA